MITLEQSSSEFETNANATGMQQFRLHKRGTNPEGKNVYIYIRSYSTGERLGKLFGVEVFIPKVKKAGTYPLPNGKTITYAEDFEEYPGASLFGKSAWFFQNVEAAERRFELLMQRGAVVEETEEEDEVKEETSTKGRGRPKVERPPLVIPGGEFSVKEIAEQNKVDYPIAFLFVKEQVSVGKLKPTRTERRAARGKETQLFQLTSA